MQTFVRRLGLLTALLLVTTLGCAETVGDIDRTQPNRIQKSILNGEWYLARTVIDVPYTTEFTFIGESAELERVRWDIQKDLLVAYRIYDRVDGTDKSVQYSEAPYQGAPIVAYPILSHFDIVREYNPQTGEQTNVLVENTTDRPWYERDYMRVDWSKNTLPSLTFLLNWSGFSNGSYSVSSPVSYQVEDPSHPHHMVVGVRTPDGQWQDHRHHNEIGNLSSADYLETTTRVYVEPTHMEVWDWYSDQIFMDPSCWYYLNQDCEHQNVVIRTSFVKVPEKTSYAPLHYPDNELLRDPATGQPIRGLRGPDGNMVRDDSGIPIRLSWFDKFGFFRVERHGYDPTYGELESNRTYHITRHNLYDEEGKPAPLIYYKSPDFPVWMNDAAQHIADQYDAVFKEVVTARGQVAPARMFEIRENTGQRIGDMRYSFLYWVPKPTLAGLLGYGPSNVDPLTGEIVSASAYVYGASLQQYAGNARQIIDVLNGYINPEDLGLGKDVQNLLSSLPPAGKPSPTESSELTMAELEAFVEQYVHSTNGQAVRKAGVQHLRRPSGWYQGQREKIRGTSFEHRLINDEIKLLRGRSLLGPGDPVPDEMLSNISPVGWLSRAHRESRRKRLQRMSRRTMYMADFVDDAIAGLALSLRDEGMKSEDVLRVLQIAVAQSTAEHEIGHTLGLRHNFSASYDALNFPRHFWDLQGAAPTFPPPPRTPQQIAGRMDEFRYSSIMEYPSRFNSDLQGLGAYDRAALMFGYGEMVEVFNQAPVDPLAHAFSDTFDLSYALQGVRHYTSLPTSLGGIDAMFDRRFVPYTELEQQLRGEAAWTLWEVPYRFCSDEYEGATAECAMYDAGMDSYEIIKDAAYRYRNYYFFRAFKRDQAGWDGFYYDSTIYFRYFRHMLTQYQHWAFLSYYDTETWEGWREDPAAYGIENVAWDLARDGGAAMAAASRAALSFLVEVIAMPQPGAYIYDADLDRYWRWDTDPNYWAQCGPDAQEKDDPTLDCVDLNVQLGVGRYSFTRYDIDSGYYFYERPKWVGAFIDKIVALETLADPTVLFLGVNTDEDVQGYALGFYLYFKDVLTRVSGGIIADDVGTFAGSTQFGQYHAPDPFQPLAAGETTVDPDTWSTVQYYAMWLGMAGYAGGFDNSFNDAIHIWYDGSDGAQEGFDPANPAVASWFDPITQRTYRAIQHPDSNVYSVGWQMVKRANELQTRIDTPSPDSDPAYDRILLNYQRELIDLAMGMWELYGKLIF